MLSKKESVDILRCDPQHSSSDTDMKEIAYVAVTDLGKPPDYP
jgi:hypothetical protein